MSASITTIKARIEALLDDIPGITLITETTRLIPTLPAAEVVVRDATRQTIAARQVRVTRNFEIYLYVAQITQPENEAVLVDALEDCYTWVDTVADFFFQRPRLERNDSGIVFGTGEIQDSGALPAAYRGQAYAAVRWILPVIDHRNY